MTPHKHTHPAAPPHQGWRKSSYSNGSGEDCVQVMPLPGGMAIADSKTPTHPELRCTTAGFTTFIEGIKAGGFGRQWTSGCP